MAIKLGNTSIGSLYLGSNNIIQAYLGSTKIYDNGGIPPGPTGGTVVFHANNFDGSWGSYQDTAEPAWSNLVGCNFSAGPLTETQVNVSRYSYVDKFNGFSPSLTTTVYCYPAFMYGDPANGTPTWIAVPQTYVMSRTFKTSTRLDTTLNTTIAYTFGTYTGSQQDPTAYFGFIETNTVIDSNWSISSPYGLIDTTDMEDNITVTWSP